MQLIRTLGLAVKAMWRNILSLGASTGSKALAYFVVTVLVERIYGTEALGAFSVALTAGLISLRLADFGVNTILIRETASDPASGPALLRSALLLRLPGLGVVALVCWVAALLVARSPRDGALIALMGAFMGLELVSKTLFANSQGRQRMVEEATAAVPTALGIVAGAVWVSSWSSDVTSVAWVFVAAGLLQLLAAVTIVRRRVTLSAAGHLQGTLVTLVREGWPVGVAALGAILYYRVDTLMLGWLVDLTAVGEYSMGYNLLYAPSLVFWAVCGAALPVLSVTVARERRKLEHRYRALALSGFGLGVLILGLIPLVPWVLRVIYADVTAASVDAFRILLASQAFSFVAAASTTTLIAVGRQRDGVAIAGLATATNVLLNLAVIPRFAAPGAAATTIVTEAVAALAGIWFLSRAGIRLFGPSRVQQTTAA